MDKLEIKQDSFIQQTQYFILVEIDLSVVPARLGIWFFHLSRRTTVIQDLLVPRQFSLVPDNRTNLMSRPGSEQLWVENQLFLTLIKIRQHKTNFEISRLFNISETAVVNIWVTWVNFMAKQWREVNMFPDRDIVRLFSPL